MSPRLRIGVDRALLGLPAEGGHGKVWARTLAELDRQAAVVPLPARAASLRRRRPQVILADGHAELRRGELPVVAFAHEAGWFTPELRAVLDPGFLAGIEPRTRAALRAADAVIVPSQAIRHDVIRELGVGPDRIAAVAHGVDSGFRPGLSGGAAIVARHAPAGAGAEPYVLYVATLHPRKQLPVLRAAMTQLADRGFPHRLVIAGLPAPDRADSTALEAAARAELTGHPGRVVRIPAASDAELAALMAGAAAFCLPSLYEGFGLTVLEAMACGAAVVVSDRGALPEVVGDTGVVVPPHAEQVAGALAVLLADPARGRALGDRAAARARGFTWARTAAGWLAVLDRAAAGRTYTRGG